MKLEEFIKSSEFHSMQESRICVSPAIPKDKLHNAISAYARHIAPQQVIILVDEGGFFSEGEEGMLITNNEIILSKDFGNRTISFNDIQSISIKNKVLMINNEVISVFKKSELAPIGYLGIKLSDFIELKIRDERNMDVASDSVLKEDKVAELKSLLVDLNRVILFKTASDSEKENFSKGKNYTLGENITEEQYNFIKFKLKLALNEEILCVSWMDLHNSKDEFFCITNDAIYSTKGNVRISLNELKDLSVCYTYKDSIFTVVEFSNEKKIFVSRIYWKVEPFAYKLLYELINFLNKE